MGHQPFTRTYEEQWACPDMNSQCMSVFGTGRKPEYLEENPACIKVVNG